jgi:hypothetical protein
MRDQAFVMPVTVACECQCRRLRALYRTSASRSASIARFSSRLPLALFKELESGIEVLLG